MANGITLVGSYHPSLQNTNTGRLTREMFLDVFARARQLASQRRVSQKSPKKKSPKRAAGA
jgi:hypothetical protein